jgi:hypothetical protein
MKAKEIFLILVNGNCFGNSEEVGRMVLATALCCCSMRRGQDLHKGAPASPSSLLAITSSSHP